MNPQPNTDAAIPPYDATADTTGVSFQALRAAALARIQELIDPETGWTDFNYHDPGVTLLEAILWAASDLAYRSDLAGHWHQRTALDHPTHLPAADLDRERADAWRVDALDRFGLRLRLPGGVARSETVIGDPGQAAIVNRVRRRQLADQLDQVRPALLRVLQSPGTGKAVCGMIRGLIEFRLGWSPSPSEILAEIADLPDTQLTADQFENERHDSLIWPPQRSQVLEHGPVTGEDHLALLARHLQALGAARGEPDWRARVRRAWVVPGLAAGIGWDGRLHQRSEPGLAAGTTLLLDLSPPEGESAVAQVAASRQAEEFLAEAALAIHSEAERSGERWYDYRSLSADSQPRRLLGEEIRIAAAGHQPISISGDVVLAPHADADEARPRLIQGLQRWLHDGESAAVTAPSTAFASGWPPGRAVTASAVTEFLRNQPGVEQVSGVSLGSEGQLGAMSIDPGHYGVPFLAGPQRGLSLTTVGGW